MKKYIIDPKYLEKHPGSFTIIRGAKPRKVAIGEGTIEVPAGMHGPAHTITVPPASQQDLKILFQSGVNYVLEIEEQEKKKPEKDE